LTDQIPGRFSGSPSVGVAVGDQAGDEKVGR